MPSVIIPSHLIVNIQIASTASTVFSKLLKYTLTAIIRHTLTERYYKEKPSCGARKFADISLPSLDFDYHQARSIGCIWARDNRALLAMLKESLFIAGRESTI